MRALTLTQPWATLVAIGAKRIETRSWGTRYRGPLAIHAAAQFPGWAKNLLSTGPFFDAFTAAGCSPAALLAATAESEEGRRILPRGAVVAVCQLVEVWQIWRVAASAHPDVVRVGPRGTELGMLSLTEQEQAFGNFAPERYAWMLADIVRVHPPIPAKGALGLWEWTPPEDEGLRAALDALGVTP